MWGRWAFFLILICSCCNLHSQTNTITPPVTTLSAPLNAAPNSSNIYLLQSEDSFGKILGTINLIIVILIFLYSLREKKEQAKNNACLFWIQEMIAKGNSEFILTYFNNTDDQLTSHHNRIDKEEAGQFKEYAMSSIQEFKKLHRQMTNRVIDPLCSISSEFENLSQLMDDIEDLVTEEISRLPSLCVIDSEKKGSSCAKFRTFRNEFYAILFDAQKRAIGIT